ncbi:Cytochrome P450 monooxygenase iccF [Paramyrothecium foliicola]|nr:Cytochrome P450 monooxygenase iccF [Paramyrothecium foliicola]
MALVTWSRLFGFGTLFLAVSFLVDFARQPTYPKHIPMLGHGRGWWAKVRNSIAFIPNYHKWLNEGYDTYGKKNLPFIAPAPVCRPADVVLPQSQVKWMMDQPDHVVSAHQAHNTVLNLNYNFLGDRLAQTPWAEHVIHKSITRHLPALVPDIQDEVDRALADLLGTDTENWKSVNLWELWLALVARVTNRLLVGEEVCRNTDFQRSVINFTDRVVVNSFLLATFPKVLHPIVGPLLAIPNWRLWRTADAKVGPVIRQRLHDMARKDAGDPALKDWEPPETFITWAIRVAKAENNEFELDPENISKRLLPIEFAAIHTTVLTGQSWLIDLLTTRPEDRILDALRDELQTHKPASGRWTKAALSSLVRTDSSIRESQRLSNFSATLVLREVIAPEGLHNPEQGWTLPQGSLLTWNLEGTHHDPELYPDPRGYDPLRFSRVREEWDQKPEEERKNDEVQAKVRGLGMVTTSDQHLAFGHGRHACPGRFFVAYELKLIAAYLLLNYDIKMLDGRPPKQWLGSNIIPPLKTCMEGSHVNPAASDVPLAHAQVDPPRQLLAQLRLQRTQLGLAQPKGLLLLALPAPAAAAAGAGQLVKLVRVVLDAQLRRRRPQPRAVAVGLLLGEHRVGDALGQLHAGLEPRRDLAVQREGLDGVLLAAALLGVHLGGQAPRGDDLVRRAQHHAGSGAAGAARRATGAVDVGIRGARDVVMQHLLDFLDVETTRRHVGGDQDRALGGGEAFQRPQRCQVEVLEQRRETSNGGDGVGEDERATARVQQQDRVEIQILLHRAALNQSLSQSLGHLAHRVDVDELGLATELQALHQIFHFVFVAPFHSLALALALAGKLRLKILVESCRKDQGLPVGSLFLVIVLVLILIRLGIFLV